MRERQAIPLQAESPGRLAGTEHCHYVKITFQPILHTWTGFRTVKLLGPEVELESQKGSSKAKRGAWKLETISSNLDVDFEKSGSINASVPKWLPLVS